MFPNATITPIDGGGFIASIGDEKDDNASLEKVLEQIFGHKAAATPPVGPFPVFQETQDLERDLWAEAAEWIAKLDAEEPAAAKATPEIAVLYEFATRLDKLIAEFTPNWPTTVAGHHMLPLGAWLVAHSMDIAAAAYIISHASGKDCREHKDRLSVWLGHMFNDSVDILHQRDPRNQPRRHR